MNNVSSLNGQVGASDGKVVRAFVSEAAASGLIPNRVKLMNIKMVFTTSLLDAQR